MLLSGREIQAFWPAGIGSPSVGGGSPPVAAPCAGGLRSGGDLKYDFDSCCQIVCSTPDVYAPGCFLTASIPALRRME
jgi:hypothetical protein